MDTMYLKFIEKNMKLVIYARNADPDAKAKGLPEEIEYNATFFDLADDGSFYAEGIELFKDYATLGKLKVVFFRGANMYAFDGRASGVTTLRGACLVKIDQMSAIATSSRRKEPRDEISLPVKLYDLPEEKRQLPAFDIRYERRIFSCTTLNVSAGGLCLVSNDYLQGDTEPYFLVEFSFGAKDAFVLPSKLMRKGDCPQTVLFKYDYGLMFIFDYMQEEKKRLAISILRAKLGAVAR